MRKFRRIAAIVAVAMFVLLPLHELVDIGEQWPYDGHVVVLLLSVIFIAGLALLCRALPHAWLASARARRQRQPASVPPVHPCTFRPGFALLFLLLCLLRI